MTQSGDQKKIIWDDSSVCTMSADAFHAKGTRDEIILLFGNQQTRPLGEKEVTVDLERQIIMSPLTVKQLTLILNQIVETKGSKSITPVGETTSPDENTESEASGKMYGSRELEETVGKDKLLFELVENLHVDYGFEKSFKMSERSFFGNRVLLAINTRDVGHEKLFDICRQMSIPQEQMKIFEENILEANAAGIGFEISDKSTIYKAYLEFWNKVKEDVRTKRDKTEPVMLHLGFKWDPVDPSKGAVAKYITYPVLSVGGILNRVSSIYDGLEDRTSLEIAEGIIKLAAKKAEDNMFIYMEVGEGDNPRKSFDINLYKATLQLQELAPFLSKACENYSIPFSNLDALLAKSGEKIFGHLSGGVGRNGKDFLTFSFEIEALQVL